MKWYDMAFPVTIEVCFTVQPTLLFLNTHCSAFPKQFLWKWSKENYVTVAQKTGVGGGGGGHACAVNSSVVYNCYFHLVTYTW
jgi:hypothetical protein